MRPVLPGLPGPCCSAGEPRAAVFPAGEIRPAGMAIRPYDRGPEDPGQKTRCCDPGRWRRGPAVSAARPTCEPCRAGLAGLVRAGPSAAGAGVHHGRMPLFAFEGREPAISPGAWIAPTATLVGDVRVEAEASVWYGAVL